MTKFQFPVVVFLQSVNKLLELIVETWGFVISQSSVGLERARVEGFQKNSLLRASSPHRVLLDHSDWPAYTAHLAHHIAAPLL